MTDPTKGRPGDEPERRLPARRPPSDTVPSRSADRFTAPTQVRAIGGLTSERAAKIVRQSGDARWVAFLGVAIVVDGSGVLTINTGKITLGQLPVALGQPGLIPPRTPTGCI